MGQDLRNRDTRYMHQALRLAERAYGHTSPNPMVGAVVVRGDEVVASGFHPKAGEPHAEVFALREAGEAARGAEVYVTLEPCSHYGRTPPCTDALIEAGVSRVICAHLDPDPRVNGRGARILRDAGIDVTVDVCDREARRLNEQYLWRSDTGRPWVALKWAQTLDGRVATASGDSRWVTGEEARRHAHVLRSRHDAVVVGIGTALADNPRLDARIDGAAQPWHVVFDSQLRLPTEAKLLTQGKTLVFCGPGAPTSRKTALEDRGALVVDIPQNGHELDVRAAVDACATNGLVSVFIEGGPTLATSFLQAGLVNRVYTFIAPRILGTGREAVGDLGADTMTDALEMREPELTACGGDWLLTGLLETA